METEPSANAEPTPLRSPSRLGSWWCVAPLALLLLFFGAAATIGSGKPFALSLLDGLVLVALAAVAGTYVILARADWADRKDSKGQE